MIEQYLGAIDPARADAFEDLAREDVVAERPQFDSILGAVVRTRWLDTPNAAERLGLTVGTLQTYR